MTDVSAMANAERAALYDQLTGLTDEQWAATTVCDPWTVRHLVAHMTALGNQTAPNFFKGLISSGFDFGKFVAKDLVKYNQGSNADVLAGFAETVENPTSPPGPKYVALGELMVHGDDIRRATGLEAADRPAEHVVTLAEMYKKTGKPLGGKKRVAGLRLRATDVDWSSGDGPEVAGPGVGLIRAMTGRSDGLADSTGDGVEILRSRCN